VVLNASKAGTFNLTLKPSAAAKTELRKKGALRVSLKLTFTPTGGEAKTTITSLTLKLKKGNSKAVTDIPHLYTAPGLLVSPGVVPVLETSQQTNREGR
jgi:hypothetical protein